MFAVKSHRTRIGTRCVCAALYIGQLAFAYLYVMRLFNDLQSRSGVILILSLARFPSLRFKSAR